MIAAQILQQTAAPALICSCPPVALDDLHVYDPSNRTWTVLSQAGNPPRARYYHGFAAAGGLLYVHAGSDGSGERLGGERSVMRCTCYRFGQVLHTADIMIRAHTYLKLYLQFQSS